MTNTELERLKGLCERATAGPWKSFYEGSGDFALYQIANDKQNVARIWASQDSDGEIVNVSGPDSCMFGGQQSDNNAAFIAASRTALPALIAEVERLRALVGLASDKFDMEEALNKAEWAKD